MSAQELSQKAVNYYKSGYNCAQSVLLVLMEHIDPEGKSDCIPKVAAGFGHGFSGCGSVCGALVGGVMAAGIEYGSNDADPKKRAKASALTQTLFKEFEKQQGCVTCRELKANKKPCNSLVEWVVENYLALEKL
jgi:C_GCAxxG_C_C family probable redox protein